MRSLNEVEIGLVNGGIGGPVIPVIPLWVDVGFDIIDVTLVVVASVGIGVMIERGLRQMDNRNRFLQDVLVAIGISLVIVPYLCY